MIGLAMAGIVAGGLLARAIVISSSPTPAAVAVPAGSAALEARFIGNMAVSITDGAVTLVTDFPYESGYSVYMPYPASEIRSSTPATLALITHRHRDHWDPERFARTNWMVAGPADVTKDVPDNRVLKLTGRTAFGPLEIEPLESPHAGIGHYSYIVTWHGRRLYFSGDTESSATLAAARDLDVAFVSPWLYRSMIRDGSRVPAKRVAIYHHRRDERVPECRANCILPRQGETIRIE